MSAPPSLFAQIREDWQAHGRDWTKPGFRAVAVHRFGVWRMTVRPKLLRAPLSLVYRALYRRCRNVYGIELPFRCGSAGVWSSSIRAGSLSTAIR